MIVIGICDDNIKVCDELKKILIQYSVEKKIDFEIKCFISAEEFCKSLEVTEYQIVFLDIVMREKNGIEIGEEVRRSYLSSVTQLVYMSAYKKYFADLFQNQTFDFLYKPLKKEAVKRVMNGWLRDFGNKDNIFWYQQGREWTAVMIRHILYFRQEKRKIYVVTKTGEDWFYAKWDLLQEQLKKHNFFFCHQSYLIHLNYVVGITNTKIKMENGEEIPISRSKQKEVQDYMQRKNY